MSAGSTHHTPDEPAKDLGMVHAEQNVLSTLSTAEIEDILRQTNGPYRLLQLVRMGRVKSEMAAEALGRLDSPPFYKRLLLAIVDTLFPSGRPPRDQGR
jgi:hypothetical protein